MVTVEKSPTNMYWAIKCNGILVSTQATKKQAVDLAKSWSSKYGLDYEGAQMATRKVECADKEAATKVSSLLQHLNILCLRLGSAVVFAVGEKSSNVVIPKVVTKGKMVVPSEYDKQQLQNVCRSAINI